MSPTTASSLESSSVAAHAGLLSVSGLSVDAANRRGAIRILDDVSFDVRAGSTLGVVGESGSGKSVTALSIMGLLPSGLSVTSGSIRLRGDDLTALDARGLRRIRGREIGMIFQDPQNSLNPAYTIGSQLIETIRAHDPSSSKSAARGRAVELLERVGITRAASRLGDYPHQFSGGMAQRVMIALAISSEPALLIADEPTTALDVTVQGQILSLLRSIQEELSTTVMLISHDLAVIAQMADDVAVMYAGEVVEHGAVDHVLHAPQHPYTGALLAAQPDAASSDGRLVAISGTVPEAGAVPDGCRFRTRCGFAVDACATTHPDLRVVGASSARCLRSDELTLTVTAIPGSRPAKVRKDARGVEPVLDVRTLTKSFRLGGRILRSRATELVAVSDVSFQVWPGETLGIVGESGAGKSTVGRLVLGLEEPTDGEVVFDGRDVHRAKGPDLEAIRHDMSVVFQNPYASLDPSMSIAESVVEPVTAHERMTRGARRTYAAELLGQVGLGAAYVHRRPHELSGGQRQRVAIARALALRPRLVVCDEAVSALDVSTQAQVLNLLADLQAEHGMAYVFVGHDLAVVHHISDRIAVMHHGHLVEIGPADDVYHSPRHPYTRALLAAVLSTDVGARQIEASVASTEAPPSSEGCPFATRCPHVMDVCRSTRPPLRPDGEIEVACHLYETGVAPPGVAATPATPN